MATFDSIFPTFLAKCGELHDLLLSVAYALFVSGIIVTVHQRFSHKVLLHLLVRIMVLTSLLVYLPVWGNTVQNLLQDSIISGLGVDPAQIYDQFLTLLIIKRDPSMFSSWWNILSQLHNITTDLLITTVLWLVGHFASLMMFWGYIFQKVILNMGYALSPLLIGFMAIPALKQIGNRYLLNLVGVLLWPLGWAVAALVTQGMLDFISNPTLEYIDPTSQLPDLQKTFGAAAIGFWIIFSTIAAPVIIQRAIATGNSVGSNLFSGAFSAGRAATTAGMTAFAGNASTGIKGAIAVAAATESLMGSSLGESSSLIGSLAQMNSRSSGQESAQPKEKPPEGNFPPSDPSGDKTVSDLINKSRDSQS